MKLYATALEDGPRRPVTAGLLADATPARRARALRYRNPRDTRRSLLAEWLLRSVAAEETGIPRARLDFRVETHGRPVLAQAADFHFSLSHSGDWVVCATDCRPLGVDVEEVRPIDLAVADVGLADDERAMLRATPPGRRQRVFYSQWTHKESYAKATGLGLHLPFQSFSIREGAVFRDGVRQRRFFLRSYRIDDRHELAVCAAHDAFPERIDYRAFQLEGHRDGKAASG